METVFFSVYAFAVKGGEIMTIVWIGNLMLLLSRLVKKRYKQERITVSLEETIKRYGVYYFCIDDLLL